MSDQGLSDQKRTPMTVIREGIAMRRNGPRLEGTVGVFYNLDWYLWVIPKSLFILFVARPLAIKILPRQARWHAHWDLFLLRLERRFLPRLSRPPQDQALVRAICREEEHNVAVFLQRGAKPDQRLSRTMPLLPYVVGRGKVPIVRLLLEAGANVEVRGIATGYTCLLRAVKSNDAEMVALLLEHGARLDVRGYEGLAPLIYAAGNGYTEVARLLIEHGADPTARCLDGLTAEDYARNHHHTEITALCASYRERALAALRQEKPASRPLYRTWAWVAISAGGPLLAFYKLSQDPKNLIWLLLGVILTNLVWTNGSQVFQQAKLRKAEEPSEQPAQRE